MRICMIDGELITDKEKLHDTLASALVLPDWYGRNLDALYDCLTDPGEETEIRFIHLPALEAHLGGYARSLQKAIQDASQENPAIHVVILATE